ncbi:MAG: hypothetical protein ACE5EL_04985, partial [Anaerolineae bacterium]
RDVVPTEYPLYRGCEGNGFTFGGYAKATYNIMRMLGMQEKLRVPVQITYGGSARIRNRVGAVVTRDQSGERVVVLVWYYIAPDSLRNAAGLRYEDLRAYGNENLRGNVEIVLDGLGPGTRHVEGYVVDETRSNGFHYRQAIADAKAPADEANTWLADNNPFAASVALERVESRDAVRTEAGRLSLRYEGVAPWTAMLIEVRSEGRATVRGEWPRPATAD